MTPRGNRLSFVRKLSGQRGALLLTFTFQLPFLVFMMTIALCLGMYSQAVIRVGQASDAAAIACAYQQQEADSVVQGLLDYYRPGFVPDALLKTHKLDTNQGCQIAAQYSFRSLTAETLPVATSPEKSKLQSESLSHSRLVTDRSGKSVEFSLVLDNSSSMNTKLPMLKRIVTSVLRDTFSVNQNVRFSIVPFQAQVGIKDAPWFPVSKEQVMCVDGLSYKSRVSIFEPERTVDELNLPASALNIKATPYTPLLDRCSDSAVIMPLTSDLQRLEQYVSSIKKAKGSTASYQGLIWGVRTLTAQWQQEWALPIQRTPSTQRLVLFSDGGDQGFILDDLIEAGFCEVIQKDLAIEMSFIGFGVSDARLEQFRQCAGNTGAVYDATDVTELEAYFHAAFEIKMRSHIVLE